METKVEFVWFPIIIWLLAPRKPKGFGLDIFGKAYFLRKYPNKQKIKSLMAGMAEIAIIGPAGHKITAK